MVTTRASRAREANLHLQADLVAPTRSPTPPPAPPRRNKKKDVPIVPDFSPSISPSEEVEAVLEEPQAQVVQSSGFFRLAAEIRNDIYTRALTVRPRALRPYEYNYKNYGRVVQLTRYDCSPAMQPSVLSILATCRQIHAEAAGIFYTINTIRLRSGTKGDYLDLFLRTINDPIRLSGIKHLTIAVSDLRTVLPIAARLTSLPRLTHLTIDWFKAGDWETQYNDITRSPTSSLALPTLQRFDMQYNRTVLSDEDLFDEFVEVAAILRNILAPNQSEELTAASGQQFLLQRASAVSRLGALSAGSDDQ